MSCYYVVFILICVASVGLLYPYIYNNTNLHPYAVGLVSLSVITFVMYGIDKLLSKIGKVRTPELILHLLAVLGGFPGGWAGMLFFHHKTKHSDFWAILAFSTFVHAVLAYYLFLMGN